MNLFEDAFWELIEEISSLQHGGPDAKHAWHDRPAVNPDRKNQHQLAGQYQYKLKDGERVYRGELNDKIEAIRSGDCSMKILSKPDCKFIQDEYGVELNKDKPKQLSNTGMIIMWDPIKDVYILKK